MGVGVKFPSFSKDSKSIPYQERRERLGGIDYSLTSGHAYHLSSENKYKMLFILFVCKVDFSNN